MLLDHIYSWAQWIYFDSLTSTNNLSCKQLNIKWCFAKISKHTSCACILEPSRVYREELLSPEWSTCWYTIVMQQLQALCPMVAMYIQYLPCVYCMDLCLIPVQWYLPRQLYTSTFEQVQNGLINQRSTNHDTCSRFWKLEELSQANYISSVQVQCIYNTDVHAI